MPRADYDLSPFGQEHFGGAALGHRWRTCSLVDLANRLARHPRGSLPEKFHDPNALRRLYDLMNTPAVNHAAVLKPPVQRTAELVLQQRGVVLQLHDPTELDFTGHTSLHDQLGQIGNGHGRGYLCHNSLAVLPGRQLLGLLGQYLPVRADVPADETPAQRREREDRASLLWLRGAQAAAQAVPEACQRQDRSGLPDGLRRVDVCDRAGDTFEFLDYEDRVGRAYVVRSTQNRIMYLGQEGEGAAALLHD
jgi:hypothetical protein